MTPLADVSAAKRSSLLRRRANLPVEAFRAHWAGPHADIARGVVGIARYTQNRVDATLWTASGGGFACDGIVELEFRDAQVMAEAGHSEAVQRLFPEDEPRFLDAITLCRVPAGARQTWPGMVKAMLAVRLDDDAAVAGGALREALQATGRVECSVDPVLGSFHRQQLGHEAEPPHAFATLWFEAAHDLAGVFGPGSGWARAARSCIVRGSVWRCDALPIVG